jgi:hypothetical protein
MWAELTAAVVHAGLLTRCFLTGVVPHGQVRQRDMAMQQLARSSHGQQPTTARQLPAQPLHIWTLVVLLHLTLQAEKCQDHADPLMCGPTSQHLADWIAAHCTTAAAGASAKPEHLLPATCTELFARLSAMFTPPGSTQALWQLAASVASHLGADTLGAGCALGAAAGANTLAQSSSNMPAVRLSAAGSLKELQDKPLAGSLSVDSRTCSINGAMGSGNCGCTGPGCLCHLAKVRSGLVSAANQLELSVRGRGVGRVCMGAARRDEVLREAAVLHLQAGDAERSCELLAEVRPAPPVHAPRCWCFRLADSSSSNVSLVGPSALRSIYV